jgi:hypothetical protein
MEYSYDEFQFPLTKEQLKTLASEASVRQRNKKIETCVKHICSSVCNQAVSVNIMTQNPTQRQICFRHLQRLGFNFHDKSFTNEVLKKVKEHFPDMRVEIDPMNTYIFIDWS